jgi:hypothetical protein
MIRYLHTPPEGDLPAGVRLVHNFYPHPDINQRVGDNGWRYWITDEPGNDRRCYCDWLGGREHYGTGDGGRIIDRAAQNEAETAADESE